MAEWSNWSGRQTDSPVAIVAPTSESDIVEAVAAAAITEMPVRAVGASHSHSRIAATNGMLLTLDGWQGIEAVDTEAQTARIRSGTRIFQLGEPLLEHGLAIRNQGDIDRQSVAGATSTGTHGTGPSLQNLSASVEGARIVLASGDVVDCSPAATPRTLRDRAAFVGCRRPDHRTHARLAACLSPARDVVEGRPGVRIQSDRRTRCGDSSLRVLLDATDRRLCV